MALQSEEICNGYLGITASTYHIFILFLATPATPFAKGKVEEPIAKMPWKPPVVSADDRVEKLTGIRKAMVKSMQDALRIPHFGYCDEISADALIRSNIFFH